MASLLSSAIREHMIAKRKSIRALQDHEPEDPGLGSYDFIILINVFGFKDFLFLTARLVSFFLFMFFWLVFVAVVLRAIIVKIKRNEAVGDTRESTGKTFKDPIKTRVRVLLVLYFCWVFIFRFKIFRVFCFGFHYCGCGWFLFPDDGHGDRGNNQRIFQVCNRTLLRERSQHPCLTSLSYPPPF